MADNKPEATKTGKDGIIKTVRRWFRDTRGEMKKVVWPAKKQVINNTAVVLVFMALMSVIIGIFDAVVNLIVTKVFLGRGV